MVNIEKKTTAQTEQGSTPETKVEASQKDQAIEETINESKKGQEILNVNQKTTTSSEALEGNIAKTTKESAINTVKKATKESAETIEDAVLKNLSLADVKNVVKNYDNDKMKVTIDVLLEKYTNLSKGISSTEGNRKTKKNLVHRLDQNIKNLNDMKKDLDKINYSNLDTYKSRVGELIYYFEHYEQVRQIVVLGGRTSDIHAIIDSEQDAKYAKKQEKKDAKYQSSMNDVLHSAAVTGMWNDDMERYEEYLEAVLNGQVEPSSHPFYTKHMQSFAMIQAINPSLYGELAPENRKGQITYNTYCQRNPEMYQAYCQNNNIVCHPKSFNRRFGERLSNALGQIFPERMNKDPRKKEARTNIGSLLAVGGAIFMGFKALQSLKKGKDDKRNWGGFFGWTAGTLALLNNDKIFQTIQDALNIHPAEKSRMLAESFKTYGFSDAQAMEMTDRYIGAPVATLSALHFIPIYELESQHILEDKNGEFEFNYKNYEDYINKFSWNSEQKKAALEAGKKLDKDKSVGAGLKAFGIATRDKLRSLFGSDKKKTLADTDEVKEGWGKMVEKVQHGVNKELYNHGLRIKNPEDAEEIMKEYDEEKDSEGINKLILRRMKGGLLEFNTNKEYTMEDMISNSNIDLENLSIKGFKSGNNDVRFNSYSELFDTYFLTEKIKYKFEGVPAKSNEPFKVNSLGQLKFDDKNWYEFFSGDTTVISRKTFTNDFPTLKNNKDYYVNYLNERRQGKNGVDTSSLDIVSQLGINFYSEKEAKELNATLKKIKDDLRFYHPTKYGDPFEIKNGVLKIKIEFTTIGESKKTWDISGLKTLSNEANKEKLLKYLNDSTNKMWGSSL